MKEVSSLKQKVEVWEKEGEGKVCGETEIPVTQGNGQGRWSVGLRKEERKGDILTHISLNYHHKHH